MTWYALVTKPQAEAQARRAVLRRGYEAWTPEAIVERRCHHVGRPRVEAVTVALFPRYLFVQLDVGQGLADALSAPNVQGVVRTRSGLCLPIPDRDVSGLQVRMEAEGGSIDLRPRSISEHFAVGTKVAVNVGPHAGIVGIIEEVVRGNVMMALDMLGRKALVSVPITAVRRCA